MSKNKDERRRNPATRGRKMLWAARGLGTIWAAFWTYFLVAHALDDGASMPYVVGGAALLIALAGLAWFAPRLGAGAFLLTAGGSGYFFDGWPAQVLLTAPAAVLAVLLFLGGRRK